MYCTELGCKPTSQPAKPTNQPARINKPQNETKQKSLDRKFPRKSVHVRQQRTEKNHHNKQATTAKSHSTVRRTWSNKKEKKPSFYREGRQNKQQTDLLCDRQTDSKCLWFSHFKKERERERERELEEKKNMNTNKLFSTVQNSSSSGSAKNRINVVSLGANLSLSLSLSLSLYCRTEKRKIRVRSRNLVDNGALDRNRRRKLVASRSIKNRATSATTTTAATAAATQSVRHRQRVTISRELELGREREGQPKWGGKEGEREGGGQNKEKGEANYSCSSGGIIWQQQLRRRSVHWTAQNNGPLNTDHQKRERERTIEIEEMREEEHQS